MKLVYLHGVGDGDPDGSWLKGLNQGLAAIDRPLINESDCIAPHYGGFLHMEGIKAKHPARTYTVKNDHDARRAFERRQARIQRSLGKSGLVQSVGFTHGAWPIFNPVQKLAILAGGLDVLKQVKHYLHDENVRAAVLSKVLDDLPTKGEILLIGHSLGSVVAIDLLDNLHPGLHVKRFITIGSPAGSPVLHQHSDRILKNFPYARVDDWSNFLDRLDLVTAGRGLAKSFMGAQDFGINGAGLHLAELYLKNQAVSRMVADCLNPDPEPIRVHAAKLDLRMTDSEATTLLATKYAHLVGASMHKDGQDRYRDALAVLQDNLAQELKPRAAAGPLPSELMQLVQGKVPSLPERWDLPSAVSQCVVLAFTNVLDPYEIDAGDARVDVLVELMQELRFPSKLGEHVRNAVRDVESAIAGRRIFGTKARIALAAAGVALIAAGPIGIAAAGAAGAAGGAAIVGGLAAFGPGGMIGGLAMLGGLASTGAAVTAVAATAHGGEQQPLSDPTNMAIQVAVAHALNSVNEPFDEELWFRLTAGEVEMAGELNRVSAFSDEKAPSVLRLKSTLDVVGRLIDFMREKGLTPLDQEVADNES